MASMTCPCLDLGTALQVGDGPGHAQDAVVRPRRQAQASIASFSRPFPASSRAQCCRICRLFICGVQPVAVGPEALPLHAPRPVDLLAHAGAGRAVGRGGQLLERHRRHLDVQVDAVQ